MKEELNLIIKRDYNKFLTYAKNMNNGKDDPRDIINECILELYEKSDEKLEKILTYIDYYIIQMVKFSSQSKTSRYQQKFNRIEFDRNVCPTQLFNNESEEVIINPYSEIEFCHIERILEENTDWYTKEVFLKYSKNKGSFRKLSLETGIPTSALYKAFLKGKEIIKENLKLERD
jgi:hypothetical protein